MSRLSRGWLRRLGPALLVLALAACAAPGQQPPATLSSVVLKASDLPKGMTLCGLSGDVDTFLKNGPANNAYVQQLQQGWAGVKAEGAQQGWVNVFAASQDQCKSAMTGNNLGGSKLALNMVVQFKTAAVAAKAFKNGDFGAGALGSQPGAEQGNASGFGPNSLTFADSESSLSLFYGVWQRARFLSLLLAVDLGPDAGRRAAHDVDGRIH